MAEQVFKAVVNDTDPSSGGKSYAVDISGSNYNHFLGKKIGDDVDGIFVGDGDVSLGGFKLQITGGSDLTGTPMRSEAWGAGALRCRHIQATASFLVCVVAVATRHRHRSWGSR